jgi:hypothetical protein
MTLQNTMELSTAELFIDESDNLPNKHLKLSRQNSFHLDATSHSKEVFEDRKYELRNDKIFKLTKWKEELRVEIRKYVNNLPTISGVSLPTTSVRKLILLLDDFTAAYESILKENIDVDKREDLGANIYVSISNARPYLDIRRFFIASDLISMLPTKRGICLSYKQFALLKNILNELINSEVFVNN